MTNQLIRSGTSIGANIREAFYGHGRSDFIAKLQITLKECSESEYRLELLIESGYNSDTTVFEHCIEMKKLLISSLNTAKKNTEQRHPYCCDVPRRRGRHIVRGYSKTQSSVPGFGLVSGAGRFSAQLLRRLPGPYSAKTGGKRAKYFHPL